MSTDFDFFIGTWHVANRYLLERLAGCTQWKEFTGRSVSRAVLAGTANFDEISFDGADSHGLTLRLYDPELDQWSLYWVSTKTPGRIEPPVVGRFTDGVGEFFGDDVLEGKPIRVRYVWSNITATTCRWEQAFSEDDEKTWEINWVMDMTRIEP